MSWVSTSGGVRFKKDRAPTEVFVAVITQRGKFISAGGNGVAAPGMKGASSGPAGRIRDCPRYAWEPLSSLQAAGKGGEKTLGVWMSWGLEDVVCLPLFNNQPGVHDIDPGGDMAYNGKVVGNIQD
jgi:hypothetical protein